MSHEHYEKIIKQEIISAFKNISQDNYLAIEGTILEIKNLYQTFKMNIDNQDVG